MQHVAEDEIRDKFRRVYNLASRSDDTSTKNGAIIVDQGWNVASGFNSVLPTFKKDPESYKRPRKYAVTEHAERACIYDAVKRCIDIKGLLMVANWVACPDCARAILLSGIGAVMCHKQCMEKTPEHWKEQVDLGLKILTDGGVAVHQWDGEVGGVEALMNGEVWYP